MSERERGPGARITGEKRAEVEKLLASGVSQRETARQCGISNGMVAKISLQAKMRTRQEQGLPPLASVIRPPADESDPFVIMRRRREAIRSAVLDVGDRLVAMIDQPATDEQAAELGRLFGIMRGLELVQRVGSGLESLERFARDDDAAGQDATGTLIAALNAVAPAEETG